MMMFLSRSTFFGIAACAAAAAHLANKLYCHFIAVKQQEQCMQELRDKMLLPLPILEQLRDEMIQQMRKALQGDRSSDMLMLPSMVDFLPNGRETGCFLAIDIGGSNMRTLYVPLSDQPGQFGENVLNPPPYTIPDEYRRCHVNELFDWIATTMVSFLAANNITINDVPTLGFCFSFPMLQNDVNHGTIVLWTKGFHITGSEGVDLVECLEDAFIRAGMPCRVSVLINDTVGTLCAARYEDQDAQIGVILGTGFNACYVEDVDNIHTLPKGYKPRSKAMVINTECGGFLSNVLPVLEEDMWVACASKPYGLRIEKLMSGLYLGEVVRRLLVRLVEKHALLGRNILHHGLHDAIHKLTTAHVAEIHGDTTPTLATTRRIVFEVFGIVSMSTQACRLVQQLCELACIRSARLLATCIAALLREIGRDGVDSPRTVIGIDGSMYEKYPQFKIEVARALDELLGTEVAGKTVLKLTRDGSSLGAAALAAAAVREVPLTDKERAKLRTLSKKRTFKS